MAQLDYLWDSGGTYPPHQPQNLRQQQPQQQQENGAQEYYAQQQHTTLDVEGYYDTGGFYHPYALTGASYPAVSLGMPRGQELGQSGVCSTSIPLSPLNNSNGDRNGADNINNYTSSNNTGDNNNYYYSNANKDATVATEYVLRRCQWLTATVARQVDRCHHAYQGQAAAIRRHSCKKPSFTFLLLDRVSLPKSPVLAKLRAYQFYPVVIGRDFGDVLLYSCSYDAVIFFCAAIF